jgi:hypothetical protein
MLAALRLRVPSLIRFRPPIPTTTSGRVVALSYLAALILFVSFISRNTSAVPYNDEYCTFRFLFGEAGTRPAEYWVQHNEHRIPLPQAVYVALVRATGYNFRAPVYFNAVVLALTTAYLLWVVRRVRGRFAVCDAFIPLTVLGLGGWENLIWGFQVQFVLSTAFVLGFLGLVVVPGFDVSVRRVATAGVLVALLPLCGANGVALVPAFSTVLFVIGVINLRRSDQSFRRPGVFALLGAAGGVALVAAYFIGLTKTAYHTPPPGWDPVIYAAVNFLGLGMGPVTHLMHEPGYARVTILGCATVGLVAATSFLLISSFRYHDRRVPALALGGLLGGMLCLAVGLAYGRAGMGNIMGASRYVTLAMPVPVTAYFAWVALSHGPGRRIVPHMLFTASVVFLVPTIRHADAIGGWHIVRMKRVEYDIKAGVPIGFLAERNKVVFPLGPDAFRSALLILKEHGARPFVDLRPDPMLTIEDIPLRVLRVESVAEEDGWLVAAGKPGAVVLALPQRRQVYAAELRYEGLALRPDGLFGAVISWEPDGATPPTRGVHFIYPLGGCSGPAASVYMNSETDAIRIELAADTRIRIHSIAILNTVP